MKKSIFQAIFKGICFVLLTMITTNGMAQYDHLSKEQKEQKSIELINETEAFILGTPVDSECFYGEDGRTIYTKIKIRVKHWYKGEDSRIIYIIRKGGIIGEDEQVSLHMRPSIQFDMDYFILLKKDGENYKFTSNINASHGRYANIYSDNPVIVGFYGMTFSSVDEINEFVRNLNGIKIPRKKKELGFQKSSSSADIIIDEMWLASLGTLHAGTGEILTIRGQNFGNRGDVLFGNANNPGTTNAPNITTSLENQYVVSWTPTEIQVIIPSIIRQGFPSGDFGVAGSGTIVVVRKNLFGFITDTEESTTKINIEYALINFGEVTNNQYDVSQGYWAREDCLNGYVFTLHESFMGNDDAINAVEAALSAWANELGITLELERRINDHGDEVYYFHNSTDAPRRNLIWFDVFDPSDQFTLMETIPFTLPDETDDNNLGLDKRWVWGSDIRIRRGEIWSSIDIWNYSLNGAIDYDDRQDFYATMLHELGHALGIQHSIELEGTGVNEKSLMYAYARSGFAASNDRTSLNQYGDKAKAAAQRLATDSRAHDWSEEFSELHGVETLAASGVNSNVLPTPSIVVNTQQEHLDGSKLEQLNPTPFDAANGYTYYWWPSGEEANSISRRVCRNRGDRSTHYVRIKNDDCTVSSLYSLPETIGDDCRKGRETAPTMANPLLTIYPNPTKGHFNIQFKASEEVELPTEIDTQIGIYDNLGRLQHQHSVSDATLRQTTIDISTLPAGMYWVVWFADGEVIDTQQVQKTE